MRIVTDSSANIVDYKDMNLGVAPLHVIVGDMDYVDDDMVDIDAMQKKLSSYKGKTSTASPSPEEWERAFGNDDIIFCITITSGLSGTYNSALAAKGKYENEHKGTLLPMDKCRGEKKALNKLVNHLKKCGYKNGKIIIAHNNNETGAEELSKLIEDEFGLFNGKINKTRALCSYYAEPGSILIGFEAQP